MQVNFSNQYLVNKFNSTTNYQTLKSQAVFKGLSKNIVDKVDLSSIYNRLNGIETISHKAFEQIAYCAEEAAKKGNVKPELLVEIMIRFVTGVENFRKNGESLSESCHKMAKKLYKEFAVNQKEKDAYRYRWNYLAKISSNVKETWIKKIVPEMEPTKKPIAFSYDDVRDMFEFLRKNWRHGNTAYRNVMHGKGLKGWMSYISEECFPSYYDVFNRKY